MGKVVRYSKDDILLFEYDLARALRADPDRQISFGPFQFYSRRYGALMRAVDVHVDEQGRTVLVGAFLRGKPHFDMSKGFPVLQPEVSIPFREVFEDLETMEGFNGAYLVSKVRKAAMDKYLGLPLRKLSNAYGVDVVSGVDFSLYPGAGGPDTIGDGDRKVASVSATGLGSAHGDVTYSFVTSDGLNGDLRSLPVADMRRIGDKLRAIDSLHRSAIVAYRKGRAVYDKEGVQSNAYDERMGEANGLSEVYYGGYPPAVCDRVARLLSRHYPDVFDHGRHTPGDIDLMIRGFKRHGGKFGFDNRGLTGPSI